MTDRAFHLKPKPPRCDMPVEPKAVPYVDQCEHYIDAHHYDAPPIVYGNDYSDTETPSLRKAGGSIPYVLVGVVLAIVALGWVVWA